jgi:hypothetical protein
MGKPLPGWSALVLKENEDVPAADGELGRVAIELKESPLAWFTGYIDDAQKSAGIRENQFQPDKRGQRCGQGATIAL